MLKLKDLWIGEDLKLKSNQKTGKFEGIGAQNHAFVKIDGKMHLIEAKDLEVYTPPKEDQELELDPELPKPNSSVFENKIDLHIDKLNPDLVNAEPTRILAFQTASVSSFIEEAIERRQYTVSIIHGIGTGQLKSEVHHILNGYKQVSHYQLINQGGATEVLLSY